MIAHSFGSVIALKLAELLENKGKSGRITFIDGAPLFLMALAAQFSKVQTDEALHHLVLANIFSTLSTQDEKFINECFSQPTWEEKVKLTTSSIDALKLYRKEYLELMMHALLNRMKIVLKTDIKVCSTKRTDATLIRPTTASVADISESYDLDVNFKEKVDVKYLEGNHFSILENPNLVDYLNNLHSTLEK